MADEVLIVARDVVEDLLDKVSDIGECRQEWRSYVSPLVQPRNVLLHSPLGLSSSDNRAHGCLLVEFHLQLQLLFLEGEGRADRIEVLLEGSHVVLWVVLVDFVVLRGSIFSVIFHAWYRAADILEEDAR